MVPKRSVLVLLRVKSVGRIARKSYVSMASSVVKRMSKSIITNLALKIEREMKAMSSDAHDSILRDTIEAVKHFSWETAWLELSHKMPTLLSLLSQLIHKPIEHKPILCFLASQLLKSRHQRMGLVQRALSHDVWQWYS